MLVYQGIKESFIEDVNLGIIADKIREKRVLGLNCEIINPKEFKMTIKTEGGLYIKELISSDEGRTNPSVTGLLNNQCICSQLDVVEVSKK